MKNVYLTAAKSIAEGDQDYCCVAIGRQFEDYYYRMKKLLPFICIFRPADDPVFWWENSDEPKNQMARTIALLLMHEIEKNP